MPGVHRLLPMCSMNGIRKSCLPPADVSAHLAMRHVRRGAVHLSLLALYGVGGWMVRRGLMPIRVLLSSIGFTFSLVFATQGVVQTLADVRRVAGSMRRCIV